MGARWGSDATRYNKCLGTPTHTGVSSASQILLEAPCFSDDASVVQSQEGLPGSSLSLGPIVWILAKRHIFHLGGWTGF